LGLSEARRQRHERKYFRQLEIAANGFNNHISTDMLPDRYVKCNSIDPGTTRVAPRANRETLGPRCWMGERFVLFQLQPYCSLLISYTVSCGFQPINPHQQGTSPYRYHGPTDWNECGRQGIKMAEGCSRILKRRFRISVVYYDATQVF
jgi:hypothetical protein